MIMFFIKPWFLPAVPNINFLWLWSLTNGMCPEAFLNFTQAETCKEEETESIQSRKEHHQMRLGGGMKNIQSDQCQILRRPRPLD